MAHPNEQVLRRAFAAFSSGDMATLRNEIFAPDLAWHFPGRSAIGGTFTGEEVFGRFFATLMERSAGTFRVEVHDILANDQHGVVLFQCRAEREGQALDDPTVGVYHLRDGRITGAWFHPTDLYAWDAFNG